MSGTELSMAYGSPYETPMKISRQEKPSLYQEQHIEKEQIRTVDLPLPKLSSAPLENPNYKVPQDVYASQGNTFDESGDSKSKYSSRTPHDGFWDKIGRKKIEVLKVFVLALIIVLGISIDHISKHYLDSYISKSFLTETQEFLVRLSYPLLVILIIWIIKAFA